MALPAILAAPALLGSLATALTTWVALALPGIVLTVLVALGVGLVTLTGAEYAVTQITAFISTAYTGLPSLTLSLLQISGITTGINMVIAAHAASLAVGAATGALTRIRLGGNA